MKLARRDFIPPAVFSVVFVVLFFVFYWSVDVWAVQNWWNAHTDTSSLLVTIISFLIPIGPLIVAAMIAFVALMVATGLSGE